MADLGGDNPSAHPLPPIDSFVEVLPVPPQVGRRRGILRFYGLTDFAAGEWAGVELVGCEGRHDGTVKGISYFKCAAGQGIFVRPSLVVPYTPPIPTPTLAAASATIDVLENTLRVARREAAAREQSKGGLEESMHSIQADLEQMRAAAVQAAAKVDSSKSTDGVSATAMEEEERVALQRQPEACEAKPQAAKQSANHASTASVAAEMRGQQAECPRRYSEAAQASPPTRTVEGQIEQAPLEEELATCAELRVKGAERQEPLAAHAEAPLPHEQYSEAQAREQERVEVAEKRCEEQLRQQLQDAASEIARLRADMAVMQKDREALAGALHDKEELRELCQPLEEELKEQKAQCDALAQLVEELGAAKTAAESAVKDAQHSAAQERACLLREVEASRAPEERVEVAGAVPGEGAAGARHTPGAATTSTPSLEAALQQCQDELDEARARILQLSSAQQVAQELQCRCDELTETIQVQRAAGQKSEANARATLAAARRDHVQQVAQLRDACEAARREAASVSAQLNPAAILHGASDGHSTPAATSSVSPLDAFREARYEARIRSLEQLLLECHATRMSSALWVVPVSHARAWHDFKVSSASLKEPVKRILDFSSPDACAASTKALFQTPAAAP
ncbi:hypothetical protein GH5_07425 [Leishmania sp. Ghana 2012 LV757]|uniref:hypothetical protein n=1 Tax=Leishmania sp. Ghana 2012 LV757 TaxID=2803181 RepID=UPI001B746C97|nr:hypothetical protein GH5_07425 [Leishmania sp. Ghana 2012 LV757]